jgi:hypothetical protein
VKVTRAIFQTPFEFFARSLETRRNNKGNNNNKKKTGLLGGVKQRLWQERFLCVWRSIGNIRRESGMTGEE